MSSKQQQGPVKATHAGLKAALFSLFAADDISHSSWSRYGLLMVAPFFILGYIVNFGIDLSKAYYAKNKNYLQALQLGSSLTYASIATTIGISILVSTNPYAAFFWYFLSLTGVSAALLQSGIKLTFHAYQAIMAPIYSIERKSFTQSMLKDIYNLALGISTYFTLLYMPGPGNDVTSAIFVYCCGLTTSVCLAGTCWEFLQSETKNQLKTLFRLNKPMQDMQPLLQRQEGIEPTVPKQINTIAPSKANWFHRTYRKATVAEHADNPDAVVKFLKSEIQRKLDAWSKQTPSSKVQVKTEALTQALKILDNYLQPSKEAIRTIEDLLNQSSAIHQSFFSHTSDTVDILEAVKCFLLVQQPSETPSPATP